MTRLLIAIGSLVVGFGCSGTSKPSTTTGEGSDSATKPAVLVKRLSLSWGLTAVTPSAEPMTDIFLATTDETGAQVSHSMGRYKGTCEVIAPAAEMNALTGVLCKAGTGVSGTELHVVVQGQEHIILVQAAWAQDRPVDPMAREEVKRITVPIGVSITVDPIQSTTGAPGVR